MSAKGLALGLIIIAAGCAPDPNAPPIIRDDREYVATLDKVRTLTQSAFAKRDRHEGLTSSEELDLKEAAPLIEGMVAYNPQSYGPYLLKGILRRTLGDDEGAEQALQQALLFVPDEPTPDDDLAMAQIHSELARIYFDKLDFENAETNAMTALDLAPEDPESLVTAASVKIQLKKGGEAKAYLQRALKVDPDNPRASELLRFIQMGSDKKPK
ncbi:MAG: hypothetical protein KIT11_00530 [Fimbriimonadaceae bacterium]|nr:hypothetical protein [Fimbriimonadaceae bacterium]QYK55141.1 MAG: hypothetical protein KF733_09005 [Fimbriimonadaceae bacterium]